MKYLIFILLLFFSNQTFADTVQSLNWNTGSQTLNAITKQSGTKQINDVVILTQSLALTASPGSSTGIAAVTFTKIGKLLFVNGLLSTGTVATNPTLLTFPIPASMGTVAKYCAVFSDYTTTPSIFKSFSSPGASIISNELRIPSTMAAQVFLSAQNFAVNINCLMN